MEEDAIAVVLARASELRSNIIDCMNRASTLPHRSYDAALPYEREAADEGYGNHSSGNRTQVGASEEEEEDDTLLNIRDALESLEAQLSSLQALQQQQLYEREAALLEIDYSRQKLLSKLKEYKGNELEVISEVSAFASEHSNEHKNNPLLNPPQSEGMGRTNPLKMIGHFMSVAGKTVITIVGIVSLLNMSGFDPAVRSGLKISRVFQKWGRRDPQKEVSVKERVEVPFEGVIDKPDVNYGFG